jgi:LysR family transcriptional regulator, benzoate and cis,cis-muconate-responsive activator of ben and cat genes
VELPFWT